MIQFHKSNKNQWTNKFACGETVGKDLTKSPSQIPERAIKVIRLGLSLCEAFSLPPRAIIKTEANRLLLAQMPFFCSSFAYESLLSTLRRITKNRTTFGWDLLALLAHPLPPRAIIKTEANRLLLAQMPFF